MRYATTFRCNLMDCEGSPLAGMCTLERGRAVRLESSAWEELTHHHGSAAYPVHQKWQCTCSSALSQLSPLCCLQMKAAIAPTHIAASVFESAIVATCRTLVSRCHHHVVAHPEAFDITCTKVYGISFNRWHVVHNGQGHAVPSCRRLVVRIASLKQRALFATHGSHFAWLLLLLT